VSNRYKPGQSGNPSGYHAKKLEREQMERDLVVELGAHNLTPSDRIELRHAIELITRRPRDHCDAVPTLDDRCSSQTGRPRTGRDALVVDPDEAVVDRGEYGKISTLVENSLLHQPSSRRRSCLIMR
jgi:hypothetical protein